MCMAGATTRGAEHFSLLQKVEAGEEVRARIHSHLILQKSKQNYKYRDGQMEMKVVCLQITFGTLKSGEKEQIHLYVYALF